MDDSVQIKVVCISCLLLVVDGGTSGLCCIWHCQLFFTLIIAILYTIYLLPLQMKNTITYVVPKYIIMSRVRKNILVTIKIVMSKRIPLWITSKILNFSLQRAYIVLYFQYTSNVGHKKVLGTYLDFRCCYKMGRILLGFLKEI